MPSGTFRSGAISAVARASIGTARARRPRSASRARARHHAPAPSPASARSRRPGSSHPPRSPRRRCGAHHEPPPRRTSARYTGSGRCRGFGNPFANTGGSNKPRIQIAHHLPRRHRRQIRRPLMLALRPSAEPNANNTTAAEQQRHHPEQQQRRLAALAPPPTGSPATAMARDHREREYALDTRHDSSVTIARTEQRSRPNPRRGWTPLCQATRRRARAFMKRNEPMGTNTARI